MDDHRTSLLKRGYVPDGKGGFYKPARALAARIPDTESKSNPAPSLESDSGVKERMLARHRVRITRKSTGELDEDNLYGSVKPILDGLQKAGLISGDSKKEIDLEVFQERVAKRCEQGTEIIITEISI